MSDPFAAPNPYASLGPSGLSGSLAMFGQPGGGNTGMEGLSYLEQLQAQEIESRMALNGQQGEAFGRMGQAPSKWATGAQTFGSIAQGLAGLGNIYLGYQNMKQQKEAFKFNKGVTNTNLNNSIMDYNRRLGDTLANRSLNNGKGESWAASELAKYSARRS